MLSEVYEPVRVDEYLQNMKYVFYKSEPSDPNVLDDVQRLKMEIGNLNIPSSYHSNGIFCFLKSYLNFKI